MHSDDQARTSFHTALDGCDLCAVRQLTRDFPELVRQGWNQGGAVQNLVLAIQKGSLPLCQLLAELGCDVHAVDERAGKATPLASAAYWGQESIVRWLLAEGVSVDGVCQAVSTPLIAAATQGHAHIAEVLLNHGAEINREHLKLPQTALDFAVLYNNTHAVPDATMKLLRERGGIRPYGERHRWPLPYGSDLVLGIENALTACVNPLTIQEDPRGAIATTRIPETYDVQLLFTVPKITGQPAYALCLPSAWPLNQAARQDGAFNWPIRMLTDFLTNSGDPAQDMRKPFKRSDVGHERWFFLTQRHALSARVGAASVVLLVPIQEKHRKKVMDQAWVDKLVEGKWSGLAVALQTA